VLNLRRVERLVFWVVPLTAVLTLLIAATLAWPYPQHHPATGSIGGRLQGIGTGRVSASSSVTGKDELAHLGRVFNDAARRLRDLYATLQQSEDRLRLVIDTIPAHVWSARPDGSVDFVNRRWLETTA